MAINRNFKDIDEARAYIRDTAATLNPHKAVIKEKRVYIVVGNDNDYDHMQFTLGTGPWINFQTANEFNPMHSHAGMISSVVYIDVPEQIAQEEYTKDTNMNCPGQIEFMYGPDVVGSNGTHKIVPKTGDFLLFHAGLKHTVYPFKSEVTRISMSFNVMGVSYGKGGKHND